MSGSSRQFRLAMTFAVDKDWLSGWRSWITVFDTHAMINMIAERAVGSSWKDVDDNSVWSSVTSADGVNNRGWWKSDYSWSCYGVEWSDIAYGCNYCQVDSESG